MPPAQSLAIESVIPVHLGAGDSNNQDGADEGELVNGAQISSGRANSKASPTATAPAWAVGTRRSLERAGRLPLVGFRTGALSRQRECY
jgi:hypothetical protein